MLEMVKPYVRNQGRIHKTVFSFYFDRNHNTQRMSLRVVLGILTTFFGKQNDLRKTLENLR